MNKLGALYQMELAKIFKGKTFKIFAILIAVVLFFTILASIIFATSGLFAYYDFDPTTFSEELQTELNNYLAQNGWISPPDSTVYNYEFFITFCEYLIDKGYDANSIPLYGDAGFYLNSSWGFVFLAMGIVGGLMCLYSVIIANTNYAREYKTGNMNLMVYQGVDRKKYFTAKWLANISSVAILSLSALLISLITVVISGRVADENILVIYNAKNIFQISAIAILALEFLFTLISVYGIMQLSYLLGNLLTSHKTSLTFSILILIFGNIATLLSGYFYVGYASFSANIAFSNLFTSTGPALRGMNIYSMIAVTLIYLLSFIIANYNLANRRKLTLEVV